jgi:hypothetical protein
MQVQIRTINRINMGLMSECRQIFFILRVRQNVLAFIRNILIRFNFTSLFQMFVNDI